MEKKINIKIVADIVCPWCFIGCNHLNASLKSRNFYKYEIDWQPFYLNPTMPSNGIERKQYLKNKFGSQVNLIESQVLNAAENYNITITNIFLSFQYAIVDIKLTITAKTMGMIFHIFI